MTMPKPFRADYSAPQVARLLGFSPNTVKAWIAAGKMRAYRGGGNGRLRIPASELDRVRNEWAVRPDVSEAM